LVPHAAEARARSGLEHDARSLEIWARAMYDFANSGYTTGWCSPRF